MNDIPTAAYEGIDARALDDSDNEISCDYRAGNFDTGSPRLSPLAGATSPVMVLCDSEAYSVVNGAKSLHKSEVAEMVFWTRWLYGLEAQS